MNSIMNKQPAITAQTKQNLTDAFWQLYCVKDIDKITVREITAKAGYNRSTFYEYFADAYDVLEQIENSLIPKPGELPPFDLPKGAFPLPDMFVKTYQEHSKYYVVLLGDNGDPSFQSKLKNSVKPVMKQVLAARGVADSFETDYTIEYTLSAMLGVLGFWFSREEAQPIEKLIDLMYDLMQNGVMKRLLK